MGDCMARPGVMLYFDMLPALKRLTKVQKADLFEALLEYAQFGVLPEFNDIGISVAWDFIQPRIDRDAQAYELKCLKNQYSVYCRETKKNEQIPMLFDDWKTTCEQSSDTERYHLMQNDQEIENEKQSKNQNNKEKQGEQERGAGGNHSPYLDSDSPEAKKYAAIEMLRRYQK